MFLTRGQPVIYYGDEQGFTGPGGDKDARQDMFATKTADYTDDEVVDGSGTSTIGSKDRFDTNAPMYKHIAALQRLRAQHPALADGTQIHRYASNAGGLFAFSRLGPDRRVPGGGEQLHRGQVGHRADLYGEQPLPADLRRAHRDPDRPRRSGGGQRAAAVRRSTALLAERNDAPAVYLSSPEAVPTVGGRAEIAAAVPENAPATVTFGYRPVGTTAWQRLGADDNAPYRVFHDVSGQPKGTLLEYRAV